MWVEDFVDKYERFPMTRGVPMDTAPLKELADAMYQENIEIEGLNGNFESRFNIVVARGEKVYKSLPCGEMEYDAAGLKKIQIGYRTTGISFIL